MTDSRKTRELSFGTNGLSILDRFGTWLSRRATSKVTKGKKNLRILELGCGFNAKNLIALYDIADELVGVDFNISKNFDGLEKFTPIESTIEAALENLIGQNFDLILIVSVLEHLQEPESILKTCKGLLKPGGALIINVPTWLGKIFLEFSAFKLGWSPKAEMDDHKMYYDKKDIWPLLVRAGFLPSSISMKYHKFALNLLVIVRYV